MIYKPSFDSEIKSFGTDISTSLLAAVLYYFVHPRYPLFATIALVLGILFSLLMLSQTLVAYAGRLYLDEGSIRVTGPFIDTRIGWRYVEKATLRERSSSSAGRTSRLLTIKSANSLLYFNTNIMTEADEEKALEFIKAKLPHLVIQQDKPA
jgi:hypothetical protein